MMPWGPVTLLVPWGSLTLLVTWEGGVTLLVPWGAGSLCWYPEGVTLLVPWGGGSPCWCPRGNHPVGALGVTLLVSAPSYPAAIRARRWVPRKPRSSRGGCKLEAGLRRRGRRLPLAPGPACRGR